VTRAGSIGLTADPPAGDDAPGCCVRGRSPGTTCRVGRQMRPDWVLARSPLWPAACASRPGPART